jgi:hypothetical protein
MKKEKCMRQFETMGKFLVIATWIQKSMWVILELL